ncbi:hypothetical protein [Bradyrhizobium sp. CCBAU 45384]|uniref:hypothetical protein n=1 Tax=Bradyrhizobium sp. CCBAU 45384 TaxID=858428 RepID=UPI002306BD9E|nr:hypothetical protein [Bradyrhizobium sp. CCBAU 45384]MDA9407250.1 hypothetical protein [Bradyrhizobium sp. CCBAU 45384]
MALEATNAWKRGHFAVTWFKRYVVSCLIAVVFFAGYDAYRRPGEDAHLATILVVSAGWPVFAALVVGGSIGDTVHGIKSGRAG